MKKKRLGNSALEITSIGLGTYALGGAGWRFAWGPQDDAQSIAAIRRAIDRGINWIDTAPAYGLGHAEEIVARALEGLAPASRPFVFTKCGLAWDAHGAISRDLRRGSLRRELEDSLRRLRVDAIDLMQIHWPGSPEALREGWETLVGLQAAGKVRHLGVSNFDVAQLACVEQIAPVTSLQPPYSIMNRGIEAAILPHAARAGIGVLAYAPMQSGLLSGKMTRARVAALPPSDWRRGHPDFEEPALTRSLAVVEVLAELARELPAPDGRPFTVSEVAIAWVLRQRGVTAAIVGARRPEQVEDHLRADAIELDGAQLARIEAARTGTTV